MAASSTSRKSRDVRLFDIDGRFTANRVSRYPRFNWQA